MKLLILKELLGWLATTASTIALVPQIVKIWRSKEATDVSVLMVASFFVAAISWTLYAHLIHSTQLLVANVIGLVNSISLLFLKFYYRERQSRFVSWLSQCKHRLLRK